MKEIADLLYVLGFGFGLLVAVGMAQTILSVWQRFTQTRAYEQIKREYGRIETETARKIAKLIMR